MNFTARLHGPNHPITPPSCVSLSGGQTHRSAGHPHHDGHGLSAPAGSTFGFPRGLVRPHSGHQSGGSIRIHADAYGGLMLGAIPGRGSRHLYRAHACRPTGIPGQHPSAARQIALSSARPKIVQEGSDVTLIGYSRSMFDILPVAAKLATAGITARSHRLTYRRHHSIWRPFCRLGGQDRARGGGPRGCQILWRSAPKISSRIHENLWRKAQEHPCSGVASHDCPVPYSKTARDRLCLQSRRHRKCSESHVRWRMSSEQSR